ncbi:MAG: iron-sulfur cluster assembly scaffold protein [Oceanicaulis sp.]|uniref:iron-sulfur cluster assembly scaffold protein n=1 Tax=unclassified Oceanicaulis TaxID=2632123 RepID=UPI000C3F4260|nr:MULTISPECIES: iron-sulfur cluster assembly scaffold protein [unclassified Oceanicaulis]MAB69676.1 iron-sulfur cluster assembly scaffold protein [Oceanicaulis sp.]MBC37923.1 iron-sulfur cluster assembly scaffold protein [Oceanicaulis sp.]MBG34682.1 iron-sulfur cluster assembly scaffold protein [Oceanicaulis sp.]HBU62362.1 iron-sulfur cluster assembly scaffold protein [Oceanicaulis sp.]|tara:strand:- start:7636 stop:8064 length:429 start_codon:yes stop_codon:yes gene_type:complete
MSEIYTNDLLELAADIPHIGRLPDPDGSASRVSRICGSELTLDLKVADGRIADLGLEVKACALGQASASVFARAALGADLEEIRVTREALRLMLKEGAPAPNGRFSALKALQPAASYRQRHGSIMLAFDAAEQAFEAALSQD